MLCLLDQPRQQRGTPRQFRKHHRFMLRMRSLTHSAQPIERRNS
jgi:hypothetical protein